MNTLLKKAIVAMTLVVFMTGCTQAPATTPANTSEVEEDIVIEETEEVNIDDIKKTLEEMKDEDYATIKAYVDEKIESLGNETASDVILMLTEKSKSVLSEANNFIYGEQAQVINDLINVTYEGHESEFEKPYRFFDEDKMKLIQYMEDTPEKEMLAIYLNKGLGLYSAEGLYYFGVDYPAYFNEYGEVVSADINEYLHILSIESKEQLTVEEYLAVSFDELSRRAVSYESYLKNAKRDETKEEIRNLLMVSIWKLVNPTPFDGLADENFVVKKEMMQVYQELVTKDEYPVVQEAVKGILAFIATCEEGVLGSYNDMDDLYDRSSELHEKASEKIEELYQ